MKPMTLDQVETYIDCPMKYHFRYVVGSESAISEFDETLLSTMRYFWTRIADGQEVNEYELLRKWESLWYQGRITKEDILRGEKRELLGLGSKGLTIVKGFYEMNQSPGIPIAVNKEFNVPIGDYIVSGTFPIIRETKPGRRIQIINYRNGSFIPDQDTVDIDLSITVQSYAFRHIFECKEHGILYHFMKSSKEILTTRTVGSYRRMLSIIKTVGNAIDNSTIYPRQSYTCKQCQYKDQCNKWGLEGNRKMI